MTKKRKGAKEMFVGDAVDKTVREEVECLPKCKYKDPDPNVCAQCLLKENCMENAQQYQGA